MLFQGRKASTKPSETHNSTGHRIDQEHLCQEGERDGELYGAAQVPRDEALEDGSGPVQRIKGRIAERKATLKANSLRAGMSARQRVKTRRARKSAASANVSVLGKRLTRLQNDKLPDWQQRLAQADEAVKILRSELAALPLIRRAHFFSAPAVVAVGISVVIYNVVVLRAALQHAGFGLHGGTLLYAVIATPLAIAAINTVLGVVAGAIALHVPTRERLQLAVIAIIVGGGALIATFALLAVFRADATSAHNDFLSALGAGAKHPKTVVVVPWWFAPLQLAGSVAAIAAVAIYTAGEDGRDLRDRIAKEDKEAKALERKCAGVEDELERTRREIETATVAVPEINVDADAAEVEVQITKEALPAELGAEDGLQESAIGGFHTAYVYTSKIFQNGQVWRVALPTIARRFNRFYTPPPGDAEKSPEPIPPQDTPPHRNGKLSPEEQKRLARSKKKPTRSRS